MTLNAYIVRSNIVEPRWIDDVGLGGLCNVCDAGSVAALAADIPFSHRPRLDVVVHRMAAITKGTGRPGILLGRIVRHPPIRARPDVVRAPHLVAHVPLRGK